MLTALLHSLASSASNSTLPIEIAMVIFLIVFLLVTFWVLWARKGTFDHSAHLPLEDDHDSSARFLSMSPDQHRSHRS